MHLTIERRMQIGFGFVVFLLLSITAISFQVSAHRYALDQQVNHPYQVEQSGDIMKQEEGRLLQQRTATMETYQRNADRIFLFLRLLTFASLLFVYRGVRTTHRKTVTTLESISDAFFSLDASWNFTYVNGQAEVLLKKEKRELIGRNIWKIFPDMEESVFGQQSRRAVTENIKVQFETYYPPLDCWYAITAYPSSEGISVYFHDVSEQVTAARTSKKAEEAIRVVNDRFRLATESGSLGVWDLNILTNALTWDERMMALYGYTPETFPGAYEAWSERLHPADRPRAEAELWDAIQGGKKFDTEFRIVLADGGIRFIKADAVVTCDENVTPTQMIGLNQDITERKEAEGHLAATSEQLEYQMLLVNEQAVELEAQKAELEEANQHLTALATTDGLTGLYNHRAFQESLTTEFVRSQRYQTPLSIILLDVDKFKTYNDTFGHPQGDKVLKTVAKALQEVARDTDCACRYGGEEFVIVLPNTDVMGALAAAERFRAALEQQPWTLRPVTASFGIATLSTDQTTAQELIDQADKALYASKENGRNRATHYVDIAVLKDLGDLEGNTSQPYSDIVREMLQIQQDTLTSASEQMRDMLASAYNATILSWSRLLDMKDKETEGHSERVTDMMVRLAHSIGMNEEECMYAQWGALLHDVGKMGVPDNILHKPGPLTAEEWVIMRQHTTVAYKMLSPITFLRPALDIPYCHHEKWDGTGYPRGLKGEEIPLSARLFAVIDVYDALTSDRPYREAWSREKTIAHLNSLSGTHFDPRAVNVFLAMLGETKPAQEEASDRLAA